MANVKNESLTMGAISALQAYNYDHNKAWTWGANWSNVQSDFETFINKYLFPKLNETALVNTDLGNRFEWLAKEIEMIAQYSEEYVFLDSIPVAMNLNKSEELMLKRNYPNMATRIYGAGILKKQKFTLNNNDVRHNFNTLNDAVKYALGVYAKKLSDINVAEEKEMRAMLVDYALTQTKDIRNVTSESDLAVKTYEAILNLQNNSDKYNETNKASGGALGRYTTFTKLSDICILTTDKIKTFLLDTKIANTFQVQGLDITNHIISFDTLGEVYKVTEDITISEQDTIDVLRTYSDYQTAIDDIIPVGTVFTFDITGLTEFQNKFVEVKPETDLFAYIFDVKKLRYRRNTKDLLKPAFYNGEFDEVTYWIHYYSSKAVSPFFNNIRIGG